jgi:hypothetical protein
MKKAKKHTLLKGEGANQHTLYGDIMVEDQPKDFANVCVKKDSVLKHEQPNGSFGEHKGLKVDNGDWVMGKQVEYNPFKREISQVWD